MYHREGKKCDEKEREREEEQSVPSRERENAKIIGSCEYLIGDPSISISIPSFYDFMNTPPPQKKKRRRRRREQKNSDKFVQKKIIIKEE